MAFNLNLANLVSLFRVALLPIIVYLILQETTVSSLYAFFFLTLALISTIADDFLARQRKLQTKVGSFLDPFADKLLIIGLLFVFLLRGSFWIIPLVIFVLRDIIVMVVRWLASQDDIQINEEKYHRLMTFFHFGLLYTLILQDFFLYQGQFSFHAFAYLGILFFTLVSAILALFSMSHHFLVYGKGLSSRKLMGKMLRREKMVIFANRRAGGYYDHYRRHLLKVFARRRKARISYLPDRKEMFEGAAGKAKNFPQIIIAGGDGSFEGALNYPPFHQRVLGFFPLGSGNALYSYFYKGKRFEYLRSRFGFRETGLDVLELAWAQGKTATTFLSLGLDAEVARLRKSKGKGFAGYLAASLRVVAAVPKSGYDLSCRINGRKHQLKNCVNLTLGKVPYHGFAIRSQLGRVKPDDGNIYGLATVNTHHSYLNKAVRFWGFLLTLFNLEKAPLLPLKGKRFVISSQEEFPLQAGGEFLGYTKWISLEVKRQQKVLVI